jgi:glycosidase
MGLTYIMTMRGIPQFYYGTEILMSNEESGDHGQIREDFPGGWQTDGTNAFTGNGLSAKQKEAQNFIKKMATWRKDNPVIHTGKLMQYAPKHDGIYVYFRYNEDASVMVIFNKSNKEMLLDSSYYHERLEGYRKGTNVLSKKTYPLGELTVPRRSVLVLELE